MTGHHVFTRSWYEYGSQARSPGTFTVELTDGLFGASTHDVIYNKLNPVFAQTQPTIAGYKPEESLLRLFHPTPDSVIVARSYFTNDEITGRGIVQYSYGLVFTGMDKEIFLQKPQRAFSYHSIEMYSEFVTRVPDDRELPYSNKFDPKMADYSEDFGYGYDKWKELGFDSDIFTKYFVSLGSVITNTRSDKKLAVLLPRGINGELLILATIWILPLWLKRKFGAVSKWAGGIDTGQKTSLSSIHLFCYTNEAPPHDTQEIVIDLTGAKAHKNLIPVSYQERVFAEWIWQNIPYPENIQEMVSFMATTYKPLIERMPFDVSSHCFWLWHIFTEQKKADDKVSFEVACLAISSLVAAFGRKFDEFFKDRDLLVEIFTAFWDGLKSESISEINRETSKALCTLAASNTVVEGISTRGLVKPLFVKLMKAEKYESLEPIIQYYSKYFKDEGPAELVAEALPLFCILAGSSTNKYSDDAVALLGKYASSCAQAKLRGIDAERRFDQFFTILDLFAKQGRQFQLDYASFEDMPGTPQFSIDFVEVETAVRQYFNKRPPGAKQLALTETWMTWLDAARRYEAFASLLRIYWNADEFHDPENRLRYVKYLFENNMLSVYVSHGVGREYIRKVFQDEFDQAVISLTNASPSVKIEKLSYWRDVFSNICGFMDSDIVFESFNEEVSNLLLSEVDLIFKEATPAAMEDLLKLMNRSSVMGNMSSPLIRVINTICRIDALGKIDGAFSATYHEWAGFESFIIARIDYWISKVGQIPSDWALSKAVCEMNESGLWQNRQLAIEKYLGFLRSDRQAGNDLIKMYDALRIITGSAGFERDINVNLFDGIRMRIEQLVIKLRSENTIDILISTADEYAKLYAPGQSPRPDVLMIGQMISGHVKQVYRERKMQVPLEMLIKFNPAESRAARRSKAQQNNPLKSAVFLMSCAVYVVGIISIIVLFLSETGLAAAINILPLPLVIVAGVSGILSFGLSFQRLFS